VDCWQAGRGGHRHAADGPSGDEVTTQSIQGDRLPDAKRDELESDACLVQMLIEGSEDALARLYDRHAPSVFAEATRASRDRWIAAEVVQETFLALWNRAELFDPCRGELRAWLLTIAHNRAIDHIRRAKRHDRATVFSSFNADGGSDAATVEWLAASGEPVAAAGPEPGPETWLSREETRASIADAVASLAPFERSVILLAYDGGLSQSEIAVRLGWPIGTVKTRTRSALRHLRDRLERSQGDVQARGAGATPVAVVEGGHPRRSVRSWDEGAGSSRGSRVCSSAGMPTPSSCQA
jgi:RNA polymerase sigma-70 factor (ECF subfamily)